MSDESSQRLLRELVADAAPVQRFPRLRVALAGLVSLWAGIAVAVLLVVGPRGDIGELWASDRAFVAAGLGLLLAGLGGSAAALAAMVPGRDSLRLAGAAMAVTGITMAGVLVAGAATSLRSTDPMADLFCIGTATALGLPLLGWMGLRARQAWVMQPSRVAVIALFAGCSMGGLVVHLICPAPSHAHFLAAHLGAGPVVALILALPATLLLRRVAH